jgi:peroxin-1
MPSKRKLAPVVSRDGINSNSSAREQEVPIIEIDTTFGRVLGLNEGQKVGLFLHLDNPIAETVNIEPLTPADWESTYCNLFSIKNYSNKITSHRAARFVP